MPYVTLFGPTGSGKSALAVALARALNGEIINADSRQVYRGLPLITACPGAADYAAVPHHLFEFLPVTETYSAGRYAAEAAAKIADIQARGKLPVVVGGTGFYLKALLQGDAAAAPPVPAEVGQELRQRLKDEGLAALVADLRARDPAAAAALDLANPQRVLRALGVVLGTGRKFSSFKGQGGGAAADALCLAVNPPVEELNARLAQRWQAMQAAGVVEEVRAAWGHYPPAAPGLQSVGVRELGAFLDGALPFEVAAEKYLTALRQYAKRQRTWLRTQYPARLVFENPADTATMVAQVASRLVA